MVSLREKVQACLNIAIEVLEEEKHKAPVRFRKLAHSSTREINESDSDDTSIPGATDSQ